MEKITMDSFKNNKVLIFITFLLAFFSLWFDQLAPTYVKEGEAFVWTIIEFVLVVPLVSIWFQMVWNRILVKIFPFKQISYGVAILLSVVLYVAFGL